MIVHLLRWLFGYYDISVEGKFTERFINLAARKGVNMWKLRNINGCICFCTGKNEWNTAQSAAEKTQNSIHPLSSMLDEPLVVGTRHGDVGIVVPGNESLVAHAA